MSVTTHQFTFELESGERIDKYLASKLGGTSRASIQKCIEMGLVTVDQQTVNKPSYKLDKGHVISISLADLEEKTLQAEEIPLDILYVDENTIVINKQANMVVHPGAGNVDGTLVNALLAQYPEIREVGDLERPGIVHRLDKETSGILLIARTQQAYEWYVAQFKSRKTKKVYVALVDGHPPTPEGKIIAPILRDSKYRQKMTVGMQGQGRSAITEYYRVESFPQHDYLEVHPLTGRTHQIRVHLAYLGCPIVGDTVYGRKHPSITMERFFLHAQDLFIRVFGDEELSHFRAETPEELVNILKNLRSG